MPLTSTTMLLPTSMPQSWASAIRFVSGGLSGLSGGSSSSSSLPALSRYLLQRVDFGGEEVGLRSRHDHHRRVVRHGARLREHELVDRVVLAAERVGDGVVAVAFGRRGVFFAVALREVHLLLLTLDDLDDAGRDVLLGVGRDALGPALVAEEDGAVALDLVLGRDRRLLVGIDVVGRDLLRHVLVFSSASRDSAGSSPLPANTVICSGASSFARTLRV